MERLRSLASLALALSLLSLAAAASPPKAITLIRVGGVPLPSSLRWALDVRWAGENAVFLATGKGGVNRLDFSTPETRVAPFLPTSPSHHGLWFAARLGVSPSFLAVGAPLDALAWVSQAGAADVCVADIDALIDLDVHGDRLALLGARRDGKGRWAADGAIAWVGTLSRGLTDLKPVHFSVSGPGAENLNKCGPLDLGVVRFLADGSLVVVPGVEDGVFLYGPGGDLRRTWSSSSLGFFGGCPMTLAEAERVTASPQLSRGWVNARATVDDVVPLDGGLALVIRRVQNQRAEWRLVILDTGAAEPKAELPLEVGNASALSHLKGDVRGSSVVWLRVERGLLDGTPNVPPALVLMEVR